MQDITFLFSLFSGGAIALYLSWLICQYNGKVFFYYFRVLCRRVSPEAGKRFELREAFYSDLSMAAICMTGLMPLAFLSLATAALGRCFNSAYATVLLEFAITGFYFFIPASIQQQFDLLGVRTLKQNSRAVLYAILWCFSFAAWATLSRRAGLDAMLLNTNPDMWAYVRRIAGFTTENLSFYGGSDSFTFPGHSACAFLLGSPKKFSSFLASLISYPFRGSSLGIAVFQSALGGALLLALFKEWIEARWTEGDRFKWGEGLALAWILSSPPLYWLMISAYFSNALFVLVTALALREARQAARQKKVETPENFIFFFAVLAIVFSFYPAFIPVIALAYLATLYLYMPKRESQKILRLMLTFTALLIGCGIIFALLFSSQLGLEEVGKSLNFTRRHGSNFVPLNPWSLLQEKPKPMGSTKDFGLYINVVLGLVLSGFLGQRLFVAYQKNHNRDLLAGLAGLGLYSGYLLAHIPLSSTYRLMKIAISLVYPLAIFGLLPLLLLWKERLDQRSVWLRSAVAGIVVIHIILHVQKVFDLNPFPSGRFTLSNGRPLENLESVAIVGCPGIHSSQFYERLVGLQLARRYPDLTVNVFRSPEHLSESDIQSDLTLYGEAAPLPVKRKSACYFSL